MAEPGKKPDILYHKTAFPLCETTSYNDNV